jgi:hypothetical protein
MKSRLFFLACLFLGGPNAGIAATAHAQTPEATISGIVTDTSGAVVPRVGIVNVDVTVAKNVALGAERFLQLRVELFNAFNHPNFGLPGHTLGAPTFGVVSDAGPARSCSWGSGSSIESPCSVS